MFTATVTFKYGGHAPDSVLDRARDLLAAWYKNGQIVSREWSLAEAEDGLIAHLIIADRQALEPSSDNVYAASARDQLGTATAVVTSLVRDPVRPAACSCASPSALVLYTDYLDVYPPARCLDCFDPFPLYRLPHVHDHEHLTVLHWAADYRACDTLQMHCTVGEEFGEQQLGQHDSELSRCGRDIARRLEAALGTPVFYYLHRMRSRSESERRCPQCGQDWVLSERAHICGVSKPLPPSFSEGWHLCA